MYLVVGQGVVRSKASNGVVAVEVSPSRVK